jgi:hypothetical protein
LDECEAIAGKPVVARRDPTTLFDLIEEPLDSVAAAVEIWTSPACHGRLSPPAILQNLQHTTRCRVVSIGRWRNGGHDFLALLKCLQCGGAPILLEETVDLLTRAATRDLEIDLLGPGWRFGLGWRFCTIPSLLARRSRRIRGIGQAPMNIPGSSTRFGGSRSSHLPTQPSLE